MGNGRIVLKETKMAINYKREMDASFFERWMSVEALKRILEKLEPTDEIEPNEVGNLAVYRGDKFYGFIDIGTEKFHKSRKANDD
jgi:hypothetical protein